MRRCAMNRILIVLDEDGTIGAIYASSADTQVAVLDYAKHPDVRPGSVAKIMLDYPSDPDVFDAVDHSRNATRAD